MKKEKNTQTIHEKEKKKKSKHAHTDSHKKWGGDPRRGHL